MSDLIDRDVLKKAIGKVYGCDWDYIEKYFHIAEAVNSLPSVELDNGVHLCEFCKYDYPECPAEMSDVIFGNDKGHDNVCACAKFEIKPERTAKVIEHDASVTDTDGYKYHRSEYVCENCKKRVIGGDDYCSHCGVKLKWM